MLVLFVGGAQAANSFFHHSGWASDHDLSYLSGLRDRQAMDFALVRLIAHSALWHFNAVRLLRAVGAPDDQRWVTLGKLDDQHSQPERDQFWFDVSTLPRLADFPKREAAIVTESVVRSGSGPFTTVFPIDTQASVCSLLEVDSTDAVSADTEVLIDSVLHLYENLQGMLDYGERDTLTELLNRKTFDGAFLRAAQVQDSAQELDMPDRRATPAAAGYWLAVIDIDHFKNVNDSFGHLIGDEVLLLLARQMRSNFRFYDQLYRFGGEEFVVLMRCAGHTDALAALERFRGLIEAHAFPQIHPAARLTGLTRRSITPKPTAATRCAVLPRWWRPANWPSNLMESRILTIFN